MIRRTFILAAAAVALALGSAPAFAQNVVVNGIDPNPPFVIVEPDGKATGLDIEALEWIGAMAGFTVEHRPVAWDVIVQDLMDKKIDVIASGFSRTAERAEQLALTDSYWTITQQLVVKKDSALSPEEILTGGHSIGVKKGSSQLAAMEASNGKDGRKYTLRIYDSHALAVADVINGTIDASVMNDPAATYFANEQDVKIAGEAGLPPEDKVYGVNKENSELLAKLNEGLTALKADPSWQTLLDKYHLSESR
ncbi:MAG: ABC transporter substrate-binding protein [Deltaproteobacteria bacterium]|nr:ABC transporter substrate-binding protein [Deltaproteobacteria bacterium]